MKSRCSPRFATRQRPRPRPVVDGADRHVQQRGHSCARMICKLVNDTFSLSMGHSSPVPRLRAISSSAMICRESPSSAALPSRRTRAGSCRPGGHVANARLVAAAARDPCHRSAGPASPDCHGGARRDRTTTSPPAARSSPRATRPRGHGPQCSAPGSSGTPPATPSSRTRVGAQTRDGDGTTGAVAERHSPHEPALLEPADVAVGRSDRDALGNCKRLEVC